MGPWGRMKHWGLPVSAMAQLSTRSPQPATLITSVGLALFDCFARVVLLLGAWDLRILIRRLYA